jgi:GR25 family glycosyltransferase involved in LPS biosynthesis
MSCNFDFTIAVPDNFKFNRLLHAQKVESKNYFTYQAVSKPILDCLDLYDQTFYGFVKQEIVTRVLALFISVFQGLDLIRTASILMGRSVEVLSHWIGMKNLSNEQLGEIHNQIKNCAVDSTRCAFGILFGSLLSVISPRCFVPFLYAPETSILNDPVVKDKKYDFDHFFDQTIAISLSSATEKREILQDHLCEIGVRNWHVFEAVDGYQLPDDYSFQIKNETVAFKELYRKMPGATDKNKKARLGCYLSHLSVLKNAREKRLESVLIIEDDAIFPQTQRGVESFNKTMEELPDDWDILFIGIEHDRNPTRYSLHIDRVLSGTCLHAYAVHSRCYDRLIDDLENALLNKNDPLPPVDEVISEQIELQRYQAFAPHTLIGYQRDGLRSNITGHINASYPILRQVAQRVYSHLLAPLLTPLGLPKHKIYKAVLRIAKKLNIPLEELR